VSFSLSEYTNNTPEYTDLTGGPYSAPPGPLGGCFAAGGEWGEGEGRTRGGVGGKGGERGNGEGRGKGEVGEQRLGY